MQAKAPEVTAVTGAVTVVTSVRERVAEAGCTATLDGLATALGQPPKTSVACAAATRPFWPCTLRGESADDLAHHMDGLSLEGTEVR